MGGSYKYSIPYPLPLIDDTHSGAQLSSARMQTKEASTVNFEKTACPRHIDSFALPRKSAHVPGNGARAELFFPSRGPV